MSTAGPFGPSTGADDATVGTIAWSNPSRVTGDDASYTTAALGGAGVKENSIKLTKAGVIGGTDKSTGATLGTIEAYTSYGNSLELWGVAWTDTDINDSGFGFVVSYKESSFGVDISHYLKGTSFGFTIPAGATITGIRLEIKAFDDLGTATVNYARITVTYTGGTVFSNPPAPMTVYREMPFWHRFE